MGISYPCNALWLYWALGKLGREDLILNDLRQRWATMPSVITNNSVQEDWMAEMDSTQQFSHCAMAPLIMLYQSIAGIIPTKPGFAACEIRPRLADLEELDITARTPQGDITLTASATAVRITVPSSCEATLVLPDGSRQRFTGQMVYSR